MSRKSKSKGPKLKAEDVACPEEQPKEWRQTPDEALEKLRGGNDRFLQDTKGCGRVCIDVDFNPDPDCKKGQSPLAIIVGCADSRVPPEIVFSQGIGDLFVIRSAGNTIDAAAMGSIEYAVHVLKTPLIVVMGHECCGAVSAAVDAWRGCIEDYEGSMGGFIEPILPAVIAATKVHKKEVKKNALLRASIDTNVKRLVKRLRESSEPMLLGPIAAGKLRIVGARYDFDGKVAVIDEGPLSASKQPPAGPGAGGGGLNLAAASS